MLDENLTDDEFAQFLKQEVLACVREYEANPNDVITGEEMWAELDKLFREAEEEHRHAA